MSVRDSLLVALTALVANKLRTGLTMLGLIIGVGAVIALMAVGQGSQQQITQSIAGLGSNLVYVRPGSASAGGIGFGAGTSQTLSQNDAETIGTSVSNVVNVAAVVNAGAQVQANGQNTFARVSGASPSYADVMGLKLTSGNFLTTDDNDRSARVAVLGANIASTLFPDGSDPVGQNLRVNVGRNTLITLQIEGVLQAQGGNAFDSYDNQLLVPISTASHQIYAARGAQSASLVSQIIVQLENKDQIAAAKQEITELLLERHSVVTPDFTVESQSDIEAAITQTSRSMTVLLASIAGISLVVGGIGIMNIMLVSVTERTREIGIRKAVGASPSDILMQFLTEALVVTIAGGLMGIAGGIGTAHLMDGRDIAGLGNDVQTVISWSSVVIAFAVSVGVGLAFGLYPAERAANLRPIEALHYE